MSARGTPPLAHSSSNYAVINSAINLQMIPIRIEFDGSIEELLEVVVNLNIVLGGHDVVVALPVFDLSQMHLELLGLLDRLAHIFNNPTLLHKISIFILFLKSFNR